MSTAPDPKDAPPPNAAVEAVKMMAAMVAIPTVAALAFSEPAAMGIGAPITQVTGGTGLQVVGRGGSEFMQDFMAATFVAGAFSLVQALSTPPPTPEQQRAIAEEAERKAELAQIDARNQQNLTDDDARKQQAGLEEERRKAFFANKGPG